MPPSTTCTGAVTQQPTDKPVRRPRTALFVTCLVDLYRPSVGFATVQLLEDAGCIVDVPSAQTCCGQPAFNSGDMESARVIARQLITTFEPYEQVEGLELTELSEPEVCCGFGGTFCVKYPEISARIVGNKADDVVATGADTLLSGDMGCLLNIAGRLRRAGSAIKVRHIAEVLAGMTEGPGIGDPS
jgi:Fe-S oxidoreductase